MKSSKFDLTAVIVLTITISIIIKYVQAATKQLDDQKSIMAYGYNGRYLHDKNFTPSLTPSTNEIAGEYSKFIKFLKSKDLIMPQRSEINIIIKFCSHAVELRKNGFKGILSEDQRKPLNVGSVESKNYIQYMNQIKTVEEKNSNVLHQYIFMKIKGLIKFYNGGLTPEGLIRCIQIGYFYKDLSSVNYSIKYCEDILDKEFQLNRSLSINRSLSRKWSSFSSSLNCGSKVEKSTQHTLMIENFSSVQKMLKNKFKSDEYTRLQRRLNLNRIFCHYNEIFNSIGFTGIYNEDSKNSWARIENSNFQAAIGTYHHFAVFYDSRKREKPHNIKNEYIVKIASEIFKINNEVSKVYDECKKLLKNRGYTGDLISDKKFISRHFTDHDYRIFVEHLETFSDFPDKKYMKDAKGDNVTRIAFININLHNKVIHAIPEPTDNLAHFFCDKTKSLTQIGYNGLLSHDIGYISNYHSLDAFSTDVKDYITFLENLKPGIRTVRNALSEYVAYILAKRNNFFF